MQYLDIQHLLSLWKAAEGTLMTKVSGHMHYRVLPNGNSTHGAAVGQHIQSRVPTEQQGTLLLCMMSILILLTLCNVHTE